MFFIKKFYQLSVLSLIFLVLRLINLTIIPIFGDEAIYLDWGWRQIHLPGLLFYSVADAKQPLLLWLFGIMQSLPGDPLWQGRFVVVLFGLLTMIGLYKISLKYFDEKTAVFAAILYICIPLFSFFDRQALMETPVSAVSIWMIYLFFDLLQSFSIKNILIVGILIAVDYYLKTSSIIYVMAMVFIAGYVWFYSQSSIKKKMNWSALGIVCITQFLLIPLYLKPAFWHSLATNTRYVLSFHELLRLPFTIWWQNLVSSVQIIFWQVTPLVAICSLFGVLLIIRSINKFKIYTLFFLISINLVFVFITRSSIPRYEVALLPLICVIAAYSLSHLWNGKLSLNSIALLLVIAVPFFITLLQLISPLTYFSLLQKYTSLSQMDLYVQNWTSGYGIPEVEQYLKHQAGGKSIHVAVRLDSGNPENAMFVYNNKSTQILPVYLDGRVIDKKSFTPCMKVSTPLYYVSRDNNLAMLDNYFVEQKRFYKPFSKEYIGVYKLKTDCQGKTFNLNF